MNISIQGYSWKNEFMAGYLKWHSKPLELIGIPMDINHLAIKVGEWIVHPFSKGWSSKDIKWVKEKVSVRCFGKPRIEIPLGTTPLLLQEIIDISANRKIRLWSCYAWFYSLGLYTNKKDCVSFTKEMLSLCMGIGPLHAQTPFFLLKEIHDHGY